MFRFVSVVNKLNAIVIYFCILMVFFLYGMVIRSPEIFLLHISGSVDY